MLQPLQKCITMVNDIVQSFFETGDMVLDALLRAFPQGKHAFRWTAIEEFWNEASRVNALKSGW